MAIGGWKLPNVDNGRLAIGTTDMVDGNNE
jgi:hypothetical protein